MAYTGWYLNGIHHRLDGPAWQRWDENGELINEDYYINDKKLSKEEWKRYLFNQKLRELWG